MSGIHRGPRWAWLQIDRRPRGWGRANGYFRGVAFPLLLSVAFLTWSIYGLTRPPAGRPASLYLVSLSALGVGMLWVTVGFTFSAAVAYGLVPAAVAFVGRQRTVVFQGGVIPRFVTFGGGSGAYEVTRKVSSIGGSYWAVNRGASGTLNLPALDRAAVTEVDDRRLIENFERLTAAEELVRAQR